MTISVDQCLQFLHYSNSASGLPMVAGGIGIMLFGWRMWRICVVLSFIAIGAAGTALIMGENAYSLEYFIAGATVLGVISYFLARHAVSVLGGLIGAVIVTLSLEGMGLGETALWSSAVAAFIVSTAMACINRQQVVILVTAFIGSLLVVSGLATWVMQLPGIYGTLRGMTSESCIVAPFVVLVPMVVSCFYQSAEVSRTCTKV